MHVQNRGGKRRQMAEINVVPYIDVMLVLLVIFMITTPLLSQGVKVDLPKAKADAIAQKDREPIIVTVNAESQYFVNIAPKPDAPMSLENVSALINQMLTKDGQNAPQRAVLVKADQSINYGMVVKVMASLQQAGASSVGLITDEPAFVKNATVNSQQYSGNAWRSA
ncbi:MAG: exbD [Gammaproteobacteria bacterium]|jgi:biopolymer transport protein TolR|nr:exbD [Gammaproteobacteria bacterium]